MTNPAKEECECCHKEFDPGELEEWHGVYFDGCMVCGECSGTLAMEE